MLKNLLLTIGILLTANLLVFSQSGALKGKVMDKGTKEPIPFANIIIETGGKQVSGTSSDFDGNYTIKPINPGVYNLRATYVGYKSVLVRGIIISADKITFNNIRMQSTAVALKGVDIVDYKVPLISKDQTSSGATVTSKEISKMPNRSANAVATTVGGVFSADGERGSVRGQRTEGTVMYIDGIKVRGSSSLPQAAIDQVSVILGGIPAKYGDAVGGIINVTTKGPSRKFGAGIDLQTSQYLDKFGYNRIGLNMQGPLIKSKKKNNTSLLGYFVAGDFIYHADGRPTATGVYKVKDDKLKEIEEKPLVPTGRGQGSYMASNFLRTSDLEHIDATKNSSNYDFNFSGKIDVKTTPNTNLSLGGSMNYYKGKSFNYYYSLIDYKNNPESFNSTWRVFGKFSQRFPTKKESKSLIKNVYYTIQANYTKYNSKYWDPIHKENFFEYGYIGKFTTYKNRSYSQALILDTVSGKYAHIHNGFNDTLVDYQRSELNPILANYTSQYYSFYNKTEGNYDKIDNIIKGKGLLNGMGPQSVYSLWGNAGAIQSGYSKYNDVQISLNADGSADIGNHAIQFGFQYEQRIDRGYALGPYGLWTLMRGLTNAHIVQLDLSNPQLVYLDGVFQDTINYYRKYDANSQRVFDKNLRKNLGLPIDGTDWIDVDSYDMNTHEISYYDQDGNMKTATLTNGFSVDMFSADELLNTGNNYVSYYGYDYKGNKLSGTPSFNDFFTKKDEDGSYTRDIGAFEPIYMAGYVQDKFAFKDLIFNIGLRIDRFDANQKVLKDPYLLYNSKTAKEVTNLGTHPANIGSDYIVYVDNVKNPTTIMGYRNGQTWYNSEGAEVVDPEAYLDAGNGVSPYLENPDNPTVKPEAFKDYVPQNNFMPRISFSFPISDVALFFAHYDVLTQRPTSYARLNPMDYYFWPTRSNPTISNPNLKPEQTIDYEVGFQQKLSITSSLKISAFYREIRDQIQMFRFTAAYPKTYYSFNNIDFGTVKGLTITYDLRRTNNARVRASYTLQFANGTGSSATSASALIRSGQPNLRTTNPLSSDRRHAVNLLLDYRYSEGKKYNGPTIRRNIKGTDKVKSIQLLKNTGFNITFIGGSGTPYTKSSKIYPALISNDRVIQGSINGSRLDWTFRMDARIDRDIDIKWGKKDGENKKTAYLNIYLQILNVLNAKNVLSVYPATGNANDDGYLAAAEWQTQINQQLDSQSYRDLYLARIDSPFNYSRPRMIRLGISLNF